MTILDSGTRMHSGDELNALVVAPPVVTVVPLTGATITMAQGDRMLYVNPAGTIATLTVKLPPNPLVAQSVTIGFGQIVTALTVQDSAAGGGLDCGRNRCVAGMEVPRRCLGEVALA